MQVKIRNNYYTHNDRTFLIVELIIAITCLFIPFILYLVNDSTILHSISAYVDIENSHIYGLLLTMASMMFLFNGALYFKIDNEVEEKPILENKCTLDNETYNKKQKSKWYNLFLGVALLGIALFEYDHSNVFEKIHYFFAIVFFLGSAAIIFFVHDPRDRVISRIMAVLSIVALGLAFFLDYENDLFWAESFALVVIGIHYILESRRIWLRS